MRTSGDLAGSLERATANDGCHVLRHEQFGASAAPTSKPGHPSWARRIWRALCKKLVRLAA
eukprot:8706489-Pyramimonas_sp.AAC.1